MATHCSSAQSIFSPSFTNHSSHGLEEIAARVIKEFSKESNPDDDIDSNPYCCDEIGEIDSQESCFQEDFFQNDVLVKEFSYGSNPDDEIDLNPFCVKNGEIDSEESCFQEEIQNDVLIEGKEDDDDDEEEEEFEFPLISRDWVSCPSRSDEVFYNGPKYPVFNTNLLLEAEVIMGGRNYKEEETRPTAAAAAGKVIRLPLRMLFNEDREKSENDELNGIPTDTYCVWKPKKISSEDEEEEEVERPCNKSLSTRLSKRWKWPDLIHRSSSFVGKDRFVFLTPGKGEDKLKGKKVEQVEKLKAAEKAASVEEHGDHGGEKRRRWIWSDSFLKQMV